MSASLSAAICFAICLCLVLYLLPSACPAFRSDLVQTSCRDRPAFRSSPGTTKRHIGTRNILPKLSISYVSTGHRPSSGTTMHNIGTRHCASLVSEIHKTCAGHGIVIT
eukprot:1623599-Rhodomonas_salina.1